MTRGGPRQKAGRKAMENTCRVNLVLDEATRNLLAAHGGKSRGAYIRNAVNDLLAELVAGAQVSPPPIEGTLRGFPLKAPGRLIEEARAQAVGRFSGLSELVRTAVTRQARKVVVP